MSVNARVIAGMAIVMATLSAVLYAQPAEDDSVGLPALLRAEPAEADADYLAQIEHLKDLQSPAEKRLAGEVPGGFAGITARIKGALGGPQVPRAVHMEDILAAASGLARDGKAPLVIVEGLQVPGNDGVIESVLTPRDEEGLRLKVQCEEGVSMPPLPAAGEEPRPSPVLVIGRVKLPDPTAVDPSPTPYVLASIIMPAPGGLALRRAALYEANAQVKAPADVARRMNELWDHLGMPRKERQRVREEIRAGKSTWTRELRTLLNVAAVEAYAAFAKQHGEHELAAEGLYRAARIAHKTLGDTGRAGKLYSDAWLRYVEQGRKGGRTYYVCEQTDEGLRRASVADAVGPPMDQLNSRHILYMIMDVFTTMCGGSAGWGVIALAVITRLLIWPLTQKQLRSTREMQAVAPEIKKLQEKHKGDRQTQQRQIMALYKERGVNPLGGCLPLLIQMPILIALYKGIRMYIYRFSDQEFLWVRSGIAWTGDNLAQPDMLLLVLYTISMILFQKFTAKSTPATDP
jgi:YidC/Oxa1 family membrane protein insertase